MMRFLCALLVRLYPESFRQQWAADLRHVNDEVLNSARDRGRYTRTCAWLLADLLRNLPPAWAESRQRARTPAAARGDMLDNLRQDLRFGLRAMRSAPWFNAAAILTLSIGIGGTVALFSIVNGVILRPLNYPNEDRLVHIEGNVSLRSSVTFPDYLLMKERARSFDQVSVWQGWSLHVRDRENTLNRLNGASVSANYFALLDQRPLLGRFFSDEHDRVGHEPVVVLSHAAWRTQFGGSSDIIGRTIQIDTNAYRVIGVTEAGFVDPLVANTAIWRAAPAAFQRGSAQPTWIGFWCLARLRPEVTLAQARNEVRGIISTAYQNPKQSAITQVTQFRDVVVRSVRPTLVALLAAVAFVLLIGCANVANLLLSRATLRASEVAVRSALGASRGRVVAQLLTEGLLLSLCATIVGVLLASTGLRALVHAISARLPRAEEITLDWRVALFAVGLSAATALLFALAPALQLARLGSASAIRAGGRGVTGGSGRKLRQSLVVLETALALMLLASAGLLGRTLVGLQQIRPGFDATSVVYTRVGFPPAQFTNPAEQNSALSRVLDQISALPGAHASGAISDLPMSGAVNSTSVQRTDRPLEEDGGLSTLVRALAGDYLGSLRVPVVQGRAFTAADVPGGSEVALVNEVFAQRMFPNENPLGKVVLVRGVQREVVGVVGPVKEFTLTGELEPALYTPFAQERESWMRENMTVVLRSDGDPAAQLRTFGDAVRNADPSLTMYPPRTLASVIAADVAAPRSRALLLSLFALIAVLLATIGIGSVLAYSVSQRLPELGVRLAVGARPADVLRMVLGESAGLTGAGLLAGAIGALATGRLLARFLYGVSPADPLVLGGAVVVLLAAALIASFIPARRGARTDPAIVLRAN